MSRMAWCSLMLTAAGLAGCGGAELKATAAFAQATSASTTTLQDVVDFSHRICTQRARLSYLQHRVEKSNVVGGKPVYWSDWYKTFKPTKEDGRTLGDSWETQCAAFQGSDKLVSSAISALAAYATALNTLATDDYSGKNAGGIPGDLSGVLGEIPGVPTPVSSAIKALGGDSGGIAQLAGALKQTYAAKEVAKIVTATHPHMQTVLAGLSAYVAAVGLQVDQLEKDTHGALNEIDLGMDTKKDDNPAHVIAFWDVATRGERGLVATRKKQAAFANALQSLTQAEQTLAKSPFSATDLPTLLSLVSQVMSDVVAVQAAAQGASE